MENTVNLPLAEGEDVPDKLSELAKFTPVQNYHSPGWVTHVHRVPTSPLGTNRKDATGPTLTTAIVELVRLRQLAEAASKRLPPYKENSPPA